MDARSSSVSVVIPARNAARTIGTVLTALTGQTVPPDEIILVDDGSTDGTRAIAEAHGASVVATGGGALAGGARNAGWEAASGDVVCFLDSDAVPAPGWGEGLRRAVTDFPGAVIGCARTFAPRTPWGWVAHLQIETPYLPRGEPRTVRFVSSYCMTVPRALPVRFSASYGGEDCVFCADALETGVALVFDPRFHAVHDHDRKTFADVRNQQRRLAFGLARCGAVQQEGLHKRVLSRIPDSLLRSRPARADLPADPRRPGSPSALPPLSPADRGRRVGAWPQRLPLRLPPPAGAGEHRRGVPHLVSPERVLVGGAAVRRLGFGAMALTGPGVWGMPRDPGEARRVLHRAVELGIELIDTADSYGPDVSEQLIAEALRPYPDNVLVATKGGFARPAPGRWSPDARPDRLREACEGSLRRLQVDCIGLYQLHVVDPAVPLEESLGALFELQGEGKIRDVGVCNVDEDELERALKTGPIVSVQNRYSLAERGSERVVERCAELGIPFIAWAPLAKGFLTRPQGSVAGIAKRHGAEPGQVALAWLLQRSPVVLPIPGTASLGHLEENARAATFELEPADIERLDSLHLPGYRARRAARRTRIAMGRLKQAARREGR